MIELLYKRIMILSPRPRPQSFIGRAGERRNTASQNFASTS